MGVSLVIPGLVLIPPPLAGRVASEARRVGQPPSVTALPRQLPRKRGSIKTRQFSFNPFTRTKPSGIWL